MDTLYLKPDSTLPLVPSMSDALSWRLNTFKPSDREILLEKLNDEETREAACQAIRTYVTGWETSTAVEAYAIARIGKWVSRNAPDDVRANLTAWALGRKTAPSQAFLEGIDAGRNPD